ncbi:hypothetical protein SAMN06265379_10343 [Saccharicrinis carchari]|uniref:SatD family (SatD) n=1 Tax=Saccharicrinis carchari TaxID=1168039 RepID=A0A521CEH1_SACCC|nr:fumarate hydratase [Saccharicrinis carchari]SMO57775.1 hypothetical protein SAMN06265379_10343 [Saccharicrinis carchari]
MCNKATISADIISYTALNHKDKINLGAEIKQLLSDLTIRYRSNQFYGRMAQGDYIECAMDSPQYALRIALILKTYIKSFTNKITESNHPRIRYFKEYAVRLAIAVAPLNKIDVEHAILDGEAIYLSGRTIKKLSTSDKSKVTIKRTMYFRSPDKQIQDNFDAIVFLLDTVISRCSAKQCEVIYYKLLGLSEKEISNNLGKIQSTISQHSTAAGWLSIQKSVNYFEKYFTR